MAPEIRAEAPLQVALHHWNVSDAFDGPGYAGYRERMLDAFGSSGAEWTLDFASFRVTRREHVAGKLPRGCLEFEFELKRNWWPHIWTWVAMPALLVGACSASLLFGCSREERYSFIGANVVVLFLLAVGLTERLPTTSETPYISKLARFPIVIIIILTVIPIVYFQ